MLTRKKESIRSIASAMYLYILGTIKWIHIYSIVYVSGFIRVLLNSIACANDLCRIQKQQQHKKTGFYLALSLKMHAPHKSILAHLDIAMFSIRVQHQRETFYMRAPNAIASDQPTDGRDGHSRICARRLHCQWLRACVCVYIRNSYGNGWKTHKNTILVFKWLFNWFYARTLRKLYSYMRERLYTHINLERMV